MDTPGFNDTNRSNAETLEVLAAYLSAAYANGVSIHGIILAHSISDNRMQNSSLKQIDMVRSMCGFSSYDNLAIVTTKWPGIGSSTGEDRSKLLAREDEMRADQRFFGYFIDRGASMFRHHDAEGAALLDKKSSAAQVIDHLVSSSKRHPMKPLKLQLEMIDDGKTLAETEAGQIILSKEVRKLRRDNLQQLTDVRQELEQLSASKRSRHARDLEKLRATAEEKLGQLNKDQEILNRSIHDLHEQEFQRWKQASIILERELRARVEAKEQELADLERRLSFEARPAPAYQSSNDPPP